MKLRSWAICVVVAAGGCLGSHGLGDHPTVIVLPFAVGYVMDPDGRMVSDSDPANFPPGLGDRAARTLAARLSGYGVDASAIDDEHPLEGLADAAERGQARGAAVVVVGAVSRFDEREGTAWAVRKPAAVGYDAVLVRTADGKVLVAERASEEQRPVSDDVTELPTLIRSGGRWATRDELFGIALMRTAVRVAEAVGVRPSTLDMIETRLPRLGPAVPADPPNRRGQ